MGCHVCGVVGTTWSRCGSQERDRSVSRAVNGPNAPVAKRSVGMVTLMRGTDGNIIIGGVIGNIAEDEHKADKQDTRGRYPKMLWIPPPPV